MQSSHIKIILRAAFWIALSYFCLAFVVPAWRALNVSRLLPTLSLPLLAATLVVSVAHYIYVFGSWFLVLRWLGSEAGGRPTFGAYVQSLLPKYIPGKVVAFGVRAKHSVDAGIPGPVVSSSLVWEMLLSMASAALVAAIGLIARPSGPLHEASRWLVLAFFVGAVAFVGLSSVRRVGGRWRKWIGFPATRRRFRVVFLLFLLYVGNWVLFGLSHYLLANSFTPFPVASIMGLGLALAVAWGLGAASVIAPAGLGVREGVLFVFAVGWMPESQALLFVTLSRVVSFVSEVILTIGWNAFRLAKGTVPSKGAPADADPPHTG